MNERAFQVYPCRNPRGRYPIMVGILSREFDCAAARSAGAITAAFHALVTQERGQGYVVGGAEYRIGSDVIARWS